MIGTIPFLISSLAFRSGLKNRDVHSFDKTPTIAFSGFFMTTIRPCPAIKERQKTQPWPPSAPFVTSSTGFRTLILGDSLPSVPWPGHARQQPARKDFRLAEREAS